jgi:tetratricopeptide (TPR) repeat protein
VTITPPFPAPAQRPADNGHGPRQAGGHVAAVAIDTDPVMALWSADIDAFVTDLRERGTFSDVTRHNLVATDDGLRLADTDTPPGDLTQDGRVVFLITHGRSPAWQRGLVAGLIRRWATTGTTAIVSLLPQQHWYGRGLRTTEVTWTPAGPSVPTAETPWRASGLDFTLVDGDDATERIAVPVIERGSDWISQWSRLLLTGSAPVRTPALLLTPHDAAMDPPDSSARAEELLARFRATASPQAFMVATRLAAAPLNLRVLRALQRTSVRAGALELTEVLTSDLVQPVRHGWAPFSDLRIVYDFAYDLRGLLLARAYRDRTIEVQQVVESELAHDVEVVRNLTLRVKDPRNATFHRVNPDEAPYLRVELAVHLALGGPNLVAAQRLGRLLGWPIPVQKRRSTTSYVPESSREPGMSEILSPSGTPIVPDTRQPLPYDRYDAEGNAMPVVTEDAPNRQRDTRTAPIIGNLPLRNANFTGRRDLLDRLHDRLRAGTTAVLPEAVHGAGGVGKSQLVIEYVYRQQQDFDLIWYIPAEWPAQIQSALVSLAQRLDLPVPMTANTAVPAVLEALRRGQPTANWLLIFDNAEDPDDVEPFFPKGGTGRIVVTSRNSQWREKASSLPVDVFNRHESIELLRRRGAEISEDADRLAEALGDLPLAIELAAAYCAEKKIGADEYLTQLRGTLADLNEVADSQQDYPTLVAAAWYLSLNGLREQDPTALRLLQVCAFFAPEPISKALLSKPRSLRIDPELDPLMSSPNRLNQAIRTIGLLSLARIDYRTNSFQMHRLVQRVLVAQMPPDDRDQLQHSAHLLLAGNDPNRPDDAEHWSLYAELFPHIRASRAERNMDDGVRALILNEAKYLWRWGDHIGARDLALGAHTAWIELGDEADPDTLRLAAWLSFMHFVVGDYAAAAELNARILPLYQQTVGKNAEETLHIIGAIAADHRVAGDFAGALSRCEDVYNRSDRAFGADDPFTLRAAHNLAVSMRLSGLFGPALRLDERTHKSFVQVLGAEHADTLSTEGGINLDRRELGDYVAAHRSQETVVATARRVFKYEDHPDLLRQRHMLASFRRKAGEHHAALDASSDVLRRFRSRYGSEYPDTVLASLTVSIDLRVTGDLRAARETGEQAVIGLRALYGSDHPHTAGAEVDWAVTLRLLGESERAKAINQDALARLASNLNDSHVLVICARINLASDHFELGEYQAAHDLDTLSFAQCNEQLGNAHPTTLACGVNLAMDLRELGRRAESSTLFEEIIDRFRDTLGVEHPATAAAGAGVRANSDIDPLPL